MQTQGDIVVGLDIGTTKIALWWVKFPDMISI